MGRKKIDGRAESAYNADMTERIQEAEERGVLRVDEGAGRVAYLVGGEKRRRNWRNPEEPTVADAVARLALEYKYPPVRIRLFAPVQIGSSKREADIIVFADDAREKPLIVAECKKPETSEEEFRVAVEQAFSYAAALGAKYVWATSGIKSEYYAVSDERPRARIVVSDIPRFGEDAPERHKFAYAPPSDSGFSDLRQITEGELTVRFKRAHDALWAGGEMNSQKAFAEFNKVIFCKLWDEKKPRKPGQPYEFQIIAESTPRQTAENLAKRVRKLYEEGRKADRDVFADDIALDSMALMTIAGYLQDVHLGRTDMDSRGRAFETFLDSYFRGDFGQYFTPRPIVRFVVDALPIGSDSLVLDTSCGSGGFLLHALEKVRREADEFYPEHRADADHARRHYAHWRDFAHNKLFGVEINDDIARVAKMNMIIHEDGHTNIAAADGLLPPDKIAERANNPGFSAGKFDFIVTNPPFGAVIKQVEKAYLTNYGFGWKEVNWLEPESRRVQRPSVKTEILFLEQCRNFLRNGGYLAMVVPDSVLNTSSLQYVRTWTEEAFRIVAVVSMPQTAFKPTDAGVNCSVLFLRKRPRKKAEEIRAAREQIQQSIAERFRLEERLKDLRAEKTQRVRNRDGFISPSVAGGGDVKKTAEYKAWKREIDAEYKGRIVEIQNDLLTAYSAERVRRLPDYPIFMAIAEEIGYDATGRKTGRNDLTEIGDALRRFIAEIKEEE